MSHHTGMMVPVQKGQLRRTSVSPTPVQSLRLYVPVVITVSVVVVSVI